MVPSAEQSFRIFLDATVHSVQLREALAAVPVDAAQSLMADCAFGDEEEGNGQLTVSEISEKNAEILRMLYRG